MAFFLVSACKDSDFCARNAHNTQKSFVKCSFFTTFAPLFAKNGKKYPNSLQVLLETLISKLYSIFIL